MIRDGINLPPSDCTQPITEVEELRTVKMEVCFDGTAYHGWQRQANGISIQEVIEDRLKKLFDGRLIRIQGSSRTDAGVHALAMPVSMEIPQEMFFPADKLLRALNHLLPRDIRVRTIDEMPRKFNARFSAHAKSYVYVVNTGDINPFTNRYSWHVDDFNQLEELAEAILYFEGEHDFSSFTVNRKDIDDPIRYILKADVKTFGPLVCMRFIGTGFLYKMVRSMVGSLAFVARGKMKPSQIQTIMEARNRLVCKDTAPAQGLFLKKVYYEGEQWQDDTVDCPPFWFF